MFEDWFEEVFGEIEVVLVLDVLEVVMLLLFVVFEKLVIDLLLFMGYGGGDL